jgi:hypothetical protein
MRTLFAYNADKRTVFRKSDRRQTNTSIENVVAHALREGECPNPLDSRTRYLTYALSAVDSASLAYFVTQFRGFYASGYLRDWIGNFCSIYQCCRGRHLRPRTLPSMPTILVRAAMQPLRIYNDLLRRF